MMLTFLPTPTYKNVRKEISQKRETYRDTRRDEKSTRETRSTKLSRNREILETRRDEQQHYSGHGSMECPKHCTDLIQDINLKPIRYHPTRNVSMLYVNFPKYVKEITIRSDYESLELFAEIGGYVGLFMGVSIVQIKSILKFFISKINLKNH